MTPGLDFCETRGVLRKAYLGVVVLTCTVGMATIASGCLFGAAPQGAVTPEEQERREAAGQDDLRKAKKANTEKAYRLVMSRNPDTRAYHQAAAAVGAMRMAEATQALAKGDRVAARTLAEQAVELGDGEVVGRAKALLDELHKKQAGDVVGLANDALATGNTPEACSKAARILSEALGENPAPALLAETRAQTQAPLSACMRALIDGAGAAAGSDAIAAYAAARKAIDTPEARRVLGAEEAQNLLAALNDRVSQDLQSALQPDLKSKKWEDAAVTLRAWTEPGAVTTRQAEALRQSLRETISKDLLERGNAALGKPGADAVLADVERGLKLLATSAPAELKTLQSQLALWIQCSKLSCTPSASPKLQYTFGTTPVFPLLSPRGESSENLPTAARVWVVASGGGLGLVATQEPSGATAWAGRLSAARGWVSLASLKAEDTTDWLPVGKALEGARVWLPTGKGDALYQLGYVQSVAGNEVTVKKLGDNQTATVKRDVLRIGNMKAGQKVLAFCVDIQSPSPARFEEVVQTTAGQPIARVTCLTPDGKDDKPRNEVIGLLRSKPEWLPPRRP